MKHALMCTCGHPDVVHHLPAGRNKQRTYCTCWPDAHPCPCKKFKEAQS